MTDIKIVIADSHFLIRKGLSCLLQDHSHIRVVHEVTESSALAPAIERYHPSVLIIDPDQPGNFSADDIAMLKRRYPELGILIISNNQEKHHILDILQYNIEGYLLKECDGEEIQDAIKAVAKKEKFFCARILDSILERKSPLDCDALNLTSRELEIVKLVAEGRTTTQIAQLLCRSVHTIHTHRKNIMNKLGFSKPSELVLYAVKKGIVAA